MIFFYNFLNCNLLFFGFIFFLGFLFLVTGIFIILTESSVHSILYLMFLFLYLTEFTILLKMEFLALIFIIIYIGAVCVLMLFHIKLIKTFIHRFDNINHKDLFLPFLVISIVLPLIQIITLSFETTNGILDSFSVIKLIPETSSERCFSEENINIFKENNFFENINLYLNITSDHLNTIYLEKFIIFPNINFFKILDFEEIYFEFPIEKDIEEYFFVLKFFIKYKDILPPSNLLKFSELNGTLQNFFENKYFQKIQGLLQEKQERFQNLLEIYLQKEFIILSPNSEGTKKIPEYPWRSLENHFFKCIGIKGYKYQMETIGKNINIDRLDLNSLKRENRATVYRIAYNNLLKCFNENIDEISMYESSLIQDRLDILKTNYDFFKTSNKKVLKSNSKNLKLSIEQLALRNDLNREIRNVFKNPIEKEESEYLMFIEEETTILNTIEEFENFLIDVKDKKERYEILVKNKDFAEEFLDIWKDLNVMFNMKIDLTLINPLNDCLKDRISLIKEDIRFLIAKNIYNKYYKPSLYHMIKYTNMIELRKEVCENKNLFKIKNNTDFLKKLLNKTFLLNKESFYSSTNINFNYTSWIDLYETIKSTQILGFLLYNIYFIHLIIGAFILLIAMIGSIFLTLSIRKEKKFQKLDKQIFTDISNTIFFKK